MNNGLPQEQSLGDNMEPRRYAIVFALILAFLGAPTKAWATLEGYCTARNIGGWYELGTDCLADAYSASHDSAWTDSTYQLQPQFRECAYWKPSVVQTRETAAEKVEEHWYEGWGCGWTTAQGATSQSQHICKEGYYVYVDATHAPSCQRDPCTNSGKHVNTVTGECLLDAPRHRGERCPHTNNPIDPANGNKFQVEHDYQLPGHPLLRVQRTYNSITSEVRNSSPYSAGTRFGAHWVDYYDRTLEYYGGSPAGINFRREDGRTISFRGGSGGWYPFTPEAPEVLTETSTAFLLTDPSGNLETYDKSTIQTGSGFSTYRLVRIDAPNGDYVVLDYNASAANGGDGNPNTLDTVTDRFGHQLKYIYDAQLLVATIVLPDHQELNYTYPPLPLAAAEPGQLSDGSHLQNTISGASRLLSSVTYPNQTNRTYLYDETSFIDEPTLRGRLTGIIDESGQRYATFQYDAKGRAKGSYHGPAEAPVDATQLSFQVTAGDVSSPSVTAGVTTVLDALGHSRSYSYGIKTGNTYGTADLKNTATTGGPCGDCGATTTLSEYDSNGRLLSQTDFLGNKTLFHYDAASREDCRLEGIPGTENGTAITPAYKKTVSVYPQNARQRVPTSVNIYAANATGFSVPTSCDPASSPNMTLVLSTTYEYLQLPQPYLRGGPA